MGQYFDRCITQIAQLEIFSPTPKYSSEVRRADPHSFRPTGIGQAGQAKTGPLFSAFGLVMVAYFIYRLVKIVR